MVDIGHIAFLIHCFAFEVYLIDNFMIPKYIQQTTPGGTKKGSSTDQMKKAPSNQYRQIVDYILGITFEIWEQRQVDGILDYYAEDIDVFSLEGITHGAAAMVTQTNATLKAFPDRLLLGDDVIWSGNLERGFSSHRITSPMTNRGATHFGAATGKRVLTMNIADCEITDGRITREWLLRDNLALVSQLGLDTMNAASAVAERFDSKLRDWLRQEHYRVTRQADSPACTVGESQTDPSEAFARRVLENCWINEDLETLESLYAPYCVLHRAPVRTVSGRQAIQSHFSAWRSALPGAALSLDHICSQPFNNSGRHIAARWSVAGNHEGPFAGLDASGKPIYVVGVSHWRVLDGRIIAEWTVFDELAMLAQALDDHA